MSAVIIDGKAAAEELRSRIADDVASLASKTGIAPKLTVLLVGTNGASLSYVAGKEKALQEAGMRCTVLRLSENLSQQEIVRIIAEQNADADVHGILVQLPLPAHIDANAVTRAILPQKDVDGLHPENAGKLALGEKALVPCTPLGIAYLLKRYGIATAGKHAVIIGRSNIVGKPLSLLLAKKPYDATVTICNSLTQNIAEITRTADILIAACGQPRFVNEGMIKSGACVIDVGTSRIPDASKKSGFRLEGDVDFAAAKEKAALITPVPGGVGPMTITMLMHNLLETCTG